MAKIHHLISDYTYAHPITQLTIVSAKQCNDYESQLSLEWGIQEIVTFSSGK